MLVEAAPVAAVVLVRDPVAVLLEPAVVEGPSGEAAVGRAE